MSVSDLVGGAIGVLLSGLGIACVVASSLRGRRSDRVLLFFGTWCALYGLRLLADTPFVVETLGVPTTSAAYFRAFVTYTINVPIVMSVESVIGPGWKQWIRRMWQLQAVYAVGAIATDVLLQRPRAAMALNSPLVLLGAAIGLANLWKFRHNLSATLKSRAIGLCGDDHAALRRQREPGSAGTCPTSTWNQLASSSLSLRSATAS